MSHANKMDEWVREYERRKVAYTEAMLLRLEHAQEGDCNACAAWIYTGRPCPKLESLRTLEESAERALDEWCFSRVPALTETATDELRTQAMQAWGHVQCSVQHDLRDCMTCAFQALIRVPKG